MAGLYPGLYLPDVLGVFWPPCLKCLTPYWYP